MKQILENSINVISGLVQKHVVINNRIKQNILNQQNYQELNTKLNNLQKLIDSDNSTSNSMQFYKCASVDIASQTWTGYLAVLGEDGVYSFEETVTEGLTFGSGFTPEVGNIYSSDCKISADMFFENLAIPLTFTAATAGARVSLSVSGSPTVSGIQYKRPQDTQWTAYSFENTEGILLENVGDSVQFRNTQTRLSNASNYVTFEFSQQVNASGNVLSMINFSTVLHAYIFIRLFYGCTKLLTPPRLPAQNLVNGCYKEMFSGCTSLKSTPKLAAVNVADRCYHGMFYGCTSLQYVTDLPATVIYDESYANMFRDCTALKQAAKMPINYTFQGIANCAFMYSGCTSLTKTPTFTSAPLTVQCYQSMFLGCSSLAQTNPLPSETIAPHCYANMFNSTALVEAPQLPAQSMEEQCYYGMFHSCEELVKGPSSVVGSVVPQKACYAMFYNCKKLQNAPTLPATSFTGNRNYGYLFYGCQSLVQAPYLPSNQVGQQAYRNMFKGCKNLTKVQDVLPSTILTQGCYYGMFQDCTSLTKAPAIAGDIDPQVSAERCCEAMFKGCTNLVGKIVLPITRLYSNCFLEMFNGCSSLSQLQVHFTQWLQGATENWLQDVSATGTFYKTSALAQPQSTVRGSSTIPVDWQIVLVD